MATEYFSELNYSLANEDTQIEYALLSENAKNVFSIAGSGARCLPLLAKNPKSMDVVDMAEAQLFIVELRYQAVKALSYEEYLFFMGYRGGLPSGNLEGDSRYDLFKKLKLSDKAKSYWENSRSGWELQGFIRLGKWERHFQKLGPLLRTVLQCDMRPIFEAQSLQEQKDLYQKHWPHKRWKVFVKAVANEYVFNKFLYKGHFSGAEGKKTDSRGPSQFIEEEFHRIFHTQLVRKNYFMQVLFLGKICFEEGLPFEAQREIFEKVKSSTSQINYIRGNLLEALPQKPYDFISLSDTISYLPDAEANQILHKLHKECVAGATMVIRSFMRAPQELDSKGWKQLKDEERWAAKVDGTSVYQFHIFSKC